VGDSWELTDTHWRRLGSWAAALHEVGLAINYPGHHKHGAYLIANSDLPGFSKSDQRLLAGLVLCHRRKFRHEVFQDIPGVSSEQPTRLAVLLRLAARVERLRNPDLSPEVKLSVRGNIVNLQLESKPEELGLLLADLEAEKERLARAKFKLTFVKRRLADSG
jgi:exopolyphosphatase/guanosine-5'-triphosphate,3'-diphosphate pyrophosphatase